MDEIKDLINNDIVAVNVYFDDFGETRFNNWTIKPIGYSLITSEKKSIPLNNIEIFNLIPEMEFIAFKENIDRQMKKLDVLHKKLYKLVICTEKIPFKKSYYHRAYVLDAPQKLWNKLQKQWKDDRMKRFEEICEKCKETMIDIDETLDSELMSDESI